LRDDSEVSSSPVMGSYIMKVMGRSVMVLKAAVKQAEVHGCLGTICDSVWRSGFRHIH
jgi:hypothetical protein